MSIKWEKIYAEQETRGHAHAVYRTKVPGGWLVKGLTHSGMGGGIGLTYVPDPEYDWRIH